MEISRPWEERGGSVCWPNNKIIDDWNGQFRGQYEIFLITGSIDDLLGTDSRVNLGHFYRWMVGLGNLVRHKFKMIAGRRECYFAKYC